MVAPHDTLVAPLRCDSDMTFPYEVEKLTHHVHAETVPKTEVQCSFAARLDDIEIADSGYIPPSEIGGLQAAE